jgi:hypothetical protein
MLPTWVQNTVFYTKNINVACGRSANKSKEAQEKRGKLQYGENFVVISCRIYVFLSTGVRAIKRRNHRHMFYDRHGRHTLNFGRRVRLGHVGAHYVTLKKDLSKISCEAVKWDELSQN